MIIKNVICDHCKESLPEHAPVFSLRKNGEYVTITQVSREELNNYDRHLHRECLTKELGEI